MNNHKMRTERIKQFHDNNMYHLGVKLLMVLREKGELKYSFHKESQT